MRACNPISSPCSRTRLTASRIDAASSGTMNPPPASARPGNPPAGSARRSAASRSLERANRRLLPMRRRQAEDIRVGVGSKAVVAVQRPRKPHAAVGERRRQTDSISASCPSSRPTTARSSRLRAAVARTRSADRDPFRRLMRPTKGSRRSSAPTPIRCAERPRARLEVDVDRRQAARAASERRPGRPPSSS